ncbi:hypothetical protein KFK09_003548 [Dendrobium nobile]|uniref:Uncharacterized protein n=1 Tax=Dendrobium nobile TaxID=94219 RepID=A0A8T3C0J7_DENNO|nr:hypothetical protein KFK09_003548 [Dendrobium nobile]
MAKSAALVFLYLLSIELLIVSRVHSIRSPVFLHKNEDKWVIEFDVVAGESPSSSPLPSETNNKSDVDDLGKRDVPGGPDPQHHNHVPSTP